MLADEELIRKVLAGDVGVFGTLVERYELSICAIARSIVRDRQLAEDAAQESFLAAYRALPQLKNPRAFGPWLAMIARRQAREMAMKKPQLAALESEAASEAVATDASGIAFDQERLLTALMALPEQERAVLMLRHFDGHDAAAIAQITGESVGTINKRISRGHTRLREILKEYQL